VGTMGTKSRIVMYQHLFSRFCTLPPKMKKVQKVQFENEHWLPRLI